MTLLSTTEFRDLILPDSAALGDAALQLLLDAAEAEIDRAAGPVGDITELVAGGGRYIILSRIPSAFTSITETWLNTTTTLVPTDYLHHPDGYVIERLWTGTNSRSSWWGRVLVTYTPADDLVIREAVQRDLVRLALSYAPGVTSETIGAWSQQMAQNAQWNTSEERQSILGRLAPDPQMIVVGR